MSRQHCPLSTLSKPFQDNLSTALEREGMSIESSALKSTEDLAQHLQRQRLINTDELKLRPGTGLGMGLGPCGLMTPWP